MNIVDSLGTRSINNNRTSILIDSKDPGRLSQLLEQIPKARPQVIAGTLTNAHANLMAQSQRILARLNHPAADKILSVVSALTAPLSFRTQYGAGTWRSDITDDGTPYEFSIAFENGRANFRILWEAQASNGDPMKLWSAAERVNQSASRLNRVCFKNFERVKSLFQPLTHCPLRFSMWHGLTFDEEGKFTLKVYLNPAASPLPLSAVLEALSRLEQHTLMASLTQLLEKNPKEPVLYFSVDLLTAPSARTKVYIAHFGATANHLEKVAARFPSIAKGEITRFLQSLGVSGPLMARPALSCLATRPGDLRPELTLHFPVRDYVKRDGETFSALSSMVSEHDAALVRAIVTQDLAMDPQQGKGAISYVSFSKNGDKQKVTVYLQPHFVSPYDLGSKEIGKGMKPLIEGTPS